MTNSKKLNISIFLIWLFTLAGIIGINSEYKDWFLMMTPMDLLLYVGLLIWNSKLPFRLSIALLIPFIIGFAAEFLGVNYQLIFGNYTYGKSLGIKLWDVPVIIGVNWATLVYCSGAIARYFTKNILCSSLIGAALMVALDILIEVSAPKLDFWEFENGLVPLQNYIGWFCIAFFAHYSFQKTFWQYHLKIALHIFVAMVLFFTFFYFHS